MITGHSQDYYAFSDLSKVQGGIFLAGPTPRDAATPSWRPQALEIIRRTFSGPVFIPETGDGVWKDDYDGQVDWEWHGLDLANVILFWVPRELKHMPAMTTNVEFGYKVSSPTQYCVLGYPEGAPKMKYLHKLAQRHSVLIRHTLESTIQTAIDLAR